MSINLQEMPANDLTKEIFQAESIVQRFELLASHGDKSVKKDLKKARKKLSKLHQEQVRRDAAIHADRVQNIIEARKEQKIEAAKAAEGFSEFNFEMLDDPVSRCMAYGGLASNLQYQDISTERWIENCQIQVDNAMDGEQKIGKELQLEEAKDRQKSVQIARQIVEREFEKSFNEIPEDSRANPRLYWRSDEQTREALSLSEVKKNLQAQDELMSKRREQTRLYATLA